MRAGRGDDDDCQEKTLFSRKRFFVQDKTIKRKFANNDTMTISIISILSFSSVLNFHNVF